MSITAAKIRLFLPVFAVVFLSDCSSKRVAFDHLQPAHVPHDVLGDVLRFTLAFNERAAMGLSAGPASRWVFATIAIGMIAMAFRWMLRPDPADRFEVLGWAMVAGGAAGNLLDRLRWDRGVVDFIDVGLGDARFYIFNVADAAITIGAALLWLAFRRSLRDEPLAKSGTRSA